MLVAAGQFAVSSVWEKERRNLRHAHVAGGGKRRVIAGSA